MHKLILPILCIISFTARSQQTVGLFYNNPGAEIGYVLFAPTSSDTVFLIDKCGKRIHEWGTEYHPGLSVYLMDDGTLLHCGDADNNQFQAGGSGGIVEKLDWNGNLLWSYKISDNNQCQHHDAIQLPNGNIMAIVWDSHPKTEAQANGRISLGSEMWSEKIIEIQPVGLDSGIIVWQWRAWDHLVQDYDSTKINYGVVADHPELLDINLGSLNNFTSDWLHFNGLDYNVERDQLMISCHNLSEMYIIDHSTTLSEAASHTGGNSGRGGDFLYRWGNPQNYDRGIADDQKFYQQHNTHWIPEGSPGAGKVLLFNNGVGRPGTDYSTVETFVLPDMVNNNYPLETDSAYEPKEQDWIYTANPPESLNSFVQGGAQRLPNGNTLICEATSGRFVEVDSNSINMWEYVNPVDINGNTHQGENPFQNACFRVTYLPPDYPGFAGQILTPGAPVEENPLIYTCENIPAGIAQITPDDENLTAYPNPFETNFVLHLPATLRDATVQIHDLTGRLIYEEGHINSTSRSDVAITLEQFKGMIIVSVKDASASRVWKTTAIAH